MTYTRRESRMPTASTENTIAHAEARCRNAGVRLTEKRKHVLASLVDSNKALSAYELADAIRDQYGESIPAMSIYRILDFLQGEHLVHKLQLANKYVACTHIGCDHDHGVPQFLICGSCHQVNEITIDRSVMDALRENVENAHYRMVAEQIELNCVCERCAQAD